MQEGNPAPVEIPLDAVSEQTAGLIQWAAKAAPELFSRAFPAAADRHLRDRVMFRVVDMILSGRLGLGEMKSENKLVEDLHAVGLEVSRTPVREVLAILARDGIVRQWPQKGFAVMQPSEPEVLELLALAGEVDGLAVSRLASSDKAPISALSTAQVIVTKAASSGNALEFFKGETRFHCEVAMAAGFREAPRAVWTWRNKVHLYGMTHFQGGSQAMELTSHDHEELIGAIAAHRKEAAVEILDRHLQRTVDSLGLSDVSEPSAEQIVEREPEFAI